MNSPSWNASRASFLLEEIQKLCSTYFSTWTSLEISERNDTLAWCDLPYQLQYKGLDTDKFIWTIEEIIVIMGPYPACRIDMHK